MLELVGGVLLTIGLFTRPVAFILSGLMAFAFFIAHFPRGYTPIGNAVTVSSTLLDEQRRFSEKMASGLTRSALDRFVGVVGEAGQIVERNLYRAAELIGLRREATVPVTASVPPPAPASEIRNDSN